MKAHLLMWIALLNPSIAFADSGYQLVPIPNPQGARFPITPGYDSFNAGPMLNQSHEIALTYFTDSLTYQPYVYSNGIFTALPLSPGAANGGVAAINNSGIIVGYESNSAETSSSPVVWNNGIPTVLDQQGQPYGAALAIGDNGQIGGLVTNKLTTSWDGAATAMYWNNNVATNLGNFDRRQTKVVAINNTGQTLVSVSSPLTSDGHPVLRAPDGTITSPNLLTNWNTVTPTDMNNRGQIIGVATDQSASDGFSFLWDNGNTTRLAPYSPTDTEDSFYPNAFNENDSIVGVARSLQGGNYAALWKDGHLYNLNALITPDPNWFLWIPTDIADDGTIVGIGQYQGNWQAFLLTPTPGGSFDLTSVPEPTTLSLLALAALPLLRRRRRQQS